MSSSSDLATLVLLLGRLERLNEVLVTDVCGHHGVTPAELRVLGMLRYSEGSDPVRPTEISRWVVQTSGGLTATLRRLEAAQYVERIADPADGRVRLVALTDSGSRFYDRMLDQLIDCYSMALVEVDVGASLDAVRTLVGAFERSGRVARSAGWSLDRAVPTARR